MLRFIAALAFVAASAAGANAAPVIFSTTGTDAAAIQGTVDAFRSALGALNPNNPGSLASGRREINWDGAPDTLSAPNAFPADFFNANVPGRARGVVFSTPGTGFQLSADAANPTATPVDFANIDPAYASFFAAFSPERLFTALGSNITDVAFFVPGSNTPASTSAFGVVFSDVDLATSTSLEFFDLANVSLGTFLAPSIAGNQTFSFLGVLFNGGEDIGRVRITSGNQVLAPGNTSTDLVVMDDFIYAEPQPLQVAAVPEPGMLLLAGLGLALLALRRRPQRTP